MLKRIAEKKKIIIFSTLIVVPFFFWGFFFFNNTDEEGDVLNNVVEEKEEYPVFVGEDDFDPNINTAASFAIYYGENGDEKILYENNSDQPLPIASISKLMTALIVLENYRLEDEMRVTEQDVISRTEFRDFRGWSDTKIGDLLHPMLIESNNSAAFAFALISKRFFQEEEGDPVDIFIEKMNLKAKEIGLKKTTFINPSGLDGREDYNRSSSKEVAAFAKYIYDNKPLIFEILSMPSYRLYSSDRMVYYEAINTNTFLHGKREEWKERIIGGKTGWTYAAYGCLLIVHEAPNKNGLIVTVVLGAEDRFLETQKLINYIYNSYEF